MVDREWDFNNWNDTKTYKTMENLQAALAKIDEKYDDSGLLYVIVPEGRNKGRYSAVFPYHGGKNLFWIHHGFKVMG